MDSNSPHQSFPDGEFVIVDKPPQEVSTCLINGYPVGDLKELPIWAQGYIQYLWDELHALKRAASSKEQS